MDEQQLKLRLATLEGEIRLAEKKLQDTTDDLKNLEKTRDTANAEFENTKKMRKEELDALVEDFARIRTTYNSLIETQREVEESYTNTRVSLAEDLAKAEREVQQVYKDAEEATRAVEDRERNVSERESAVGAREIHVKNAENTVSRKIIQFEEEKIAFATEKELWEQTKYVLNTALATSHELLDDIDREIRGKRKTVLGLDIAIDLKRQDAEGIVEAKQKELEEVILQKKTLKTILENVTTKEERLDKQTKKHTILLKRLEKMMKGDDTNG